MSQSTNQATRQKRYIARIVIENTSPLSIGGIQTDYWLDSPIARDFNGLPYLPGTSIAGYLRSTVSTTIKETYFGNNDDTGSKGSSLIISDALMLNEHGKVEQGLKEENRLSALHKAMLRNPLVREHVRIDHKGTAVDQGKFDRELIPKGLRFKCELELIVGNDSQNTDADWIQILDTLYREDFSIGGGVSNNFGGLKVENLDERVFDLSKAADRTAYERINTDLHPGTTALEAYTPTHIADSDYLRYAITLNGKNTFFLFAGPYADEDHDAVPYEETYYEWNKDGKPASRTAYLIPGSSIKGILAHRVAWHYNLAKGETIEQFLENRFQANEDLLADEASVQSLSHDELVQLQNNITKELERIDKLIDSADQPIDQDAASLAGLVASSNPAVKALFGTAADHKSKDGHMGKVIVKDTWLNKTEVKKETFMHNKIDRFTGGTVDTALFSEQVLQVDQLNIELRYHKDLNTPDNQCFKECLEKAIKDIENGLLPLGARSAKGHGIFTSINHK